MVFEAMHLVFYVLLYIYIFFLSFLAAPVSTISVQNLGGWDIILFRGGGGGGVGGFRGSFFFFLSPPA